jgi:hypothetical protein
LGLKLHQQVDIEPVIRPAHPPDDVIFAAAQVLADVAGVDPLQDGFNVPFASCCGSYYLVRILSILS